MLNFVKHLWTATDISDATVSQGSGTPVAAAELRFHSASIGARIMLLNSNQCREILIDGAFFHDAKVTAAPHFFSFYGKAALAQHQPRSLRFESGSSARRVWCESLSDAVWNANEISP